MRYAVLFVLFFGLISSARADDYFTFPETEKGQYVYYYDSRGGGSRLTGLLKFYDGSIICRTVDLLNGESLVVVLKIRLKNGIYEVEPSKIISGNPGEKDLYFLMTDLMNLGLRYSENQKNINYSPLSVDDEWKDFGYTLVHTFSKTVPFFNLLSTRKKGQDFLSYQAVLTGRMSSADDGIFLRINGFSHEDNPEADFTVSGKDEKTKTDISGIIFNLDKKWKLVRGGTVKNIPHDTYWLSIRSQRDAQIGVEKIDASKIPSRYREMSAESTVAMFACGSRKIIPSSIAISSASDSDATAEYDVIDDVSGMRTKMISRIIKTGNEIMIINFSAYRETYDKNTKYFAEILKSAVVR